MIIVTGASGQLGKAVVERLLERVPAAGVGVSVRDPGKAQGWAGRGVRVRRGDFGDPASLCHAFEGASQVLIVSVDSAGPDAVQQHGNAIAAAKAVGAGRILYTSHMGARADSAFAPMSDHAATEDLLERSGVPFTSLRNGFYASSALQIMGQPLETGKIVTPPDGPVAWTAHADLAEATAIALAEEGRLDGLTPPLAAPQALTFEDVARIASEVAGRPVERVTVSDDEYRAGMVAHGIPEMRADMLLGLFVASRAGDFAAVDPTLERLLGRAATSMHRVLADLLSAPAATERNHS